MSTSNRGFASMDKDKQRLIAAKGGKEVQRKGTGHRFDSQEAAAAGRKGGRATSQNLKRTAQLRTQRSDN